MNNRFATRNLNQKHSLLGGAPLHFKIMFGIVAAFIAVVFIFIVAFYANIAINGDGGFSYEYNYKVGDIEYNESYNYGN